ncbi:MAG: M48 family metalloprotease [Desulfobacteraceae bacterium]|nr:M48 family metalloprotease [Desulfobacteraceae bacterium]
MKRWIAFALALGWLLLSGLLSGVHEASAITIQEEEELSREFQILVAEHFPFIRDPMVDKYIQGVGKKLAEQFPPQPFSFHFHVIKEDVYNAFATPAGHIYLNSGLITAMDSEDELAGIMAHEMAHVTSRHISEKIERNKKIQIATLAGLAASAFLGIGGSGELAQAAASTTIAAGQSLVLSYSREDERQADQLGLQVVAAAGYDPAGLMRMLEKIRAKQWYTSNEIPDYLSTHPTSEERLAYIDSYRTRGAESPAERPRRGSDDFIRVRTRLSALYGEKEEELRQYKNAVNRKPDDPFAHYGYALALARSGNTDAAVEQMRSALEMRAFDGVLLNDLGRIYFMSGQYEEARNTLEGVVSLDKDSNETRFLLGRTYLQLDRLEAAVTSLEQVASWQPDYPNVHLYLGNAYGRWGKMARAHYHLGMHYRLAGNPGNALFHLRKAKKLTDDPALLASIESELRKAVGEEKKAAESAKESKPLVGFSPPGRSEKTAW